MLQLATAVLGYSDLIVAHSGLFSATPRLGGYEHPPCAYPLQLVAPKNGVAIKLRTVFLLGMAKSKASKLLVPKSGFNILNVDREHPLLPIYAYAVESMAADPGFATKYGTKKAQMTFIAAHMVATISADFKDYKVIIAEQLAK